LHGGNASCAAQFRERRHARDPGRASPPEA
jgi:hypothetical protein